MRRATTLLVASAMLGATLLGATLALGALGDLAFRGCISGETATNEGICTLVDAHTASGQGSGLDLVEGVTVSADGDWVYAVARGDDSIARFARSGKGKLTYEGCVSGDSDAACKEIPTALPGGAESGLDSARALVIAPGGRWAYATSANDDAIVRFKRNPGNGKLRFGGCITGEIETDSLGTGACHRIPDAAPSGEDSGLDDPKSLTLSRDGRSLYAAATLDAAIVRFKRNPDNGKLKFRDCITGDTAAGPDGTGACRPSPDTGVNGDHTGLDDARGLAVSRDGRWLYGVSSDDDAVFRFKRDRDDGRLTFKNCITGEAESAPLCKSPSDLTANGEDSGFDDMRSLALSRDGRSLYAVSRFDSAVIRFKRDRRTGGLTYKGCLSGDANVAPAPCDPAGDPASGGDDSGLEQTETVAVTRDGRRLYVSTQDDAGVAVFRRDRDNGALDYRGCVSGDMGTAGTCTLTLGASGNDGQDSGLAFPQVMALSPDDRSLYFTAGGDASVVHFKRER